MLSLSFVLLAFIVLVGLTIVIVEAHKAPLMADDEMTVISQPNKENKTHGTI